MDSHHIEPLPHHQLSHFTFTFHFHALEKEMATHSSVLAWRIPGTGEPGGLPSMGSHRVRCDWCDSAAAAVAVTTNIFYIFLTSLLNLLQYCFCSMFWLWCHEACEILTPQNRDPACTPCTGRWGLNHWTAREVPAFGFNPTHQLQFFRTTGHMLALGYGWK